ncbi:MAG: UPF0182 family protein [Candidatus Aenigmarchaeota archaeon]|nr:UPF0182 family protein [Candidatus Aenigmarchaeota archaeon]
MKFSQIVIVALLAVMVVFSASMGMLGDWLWFTAIGYDSVFLTILSTAITIGLISFILFFAFSAVNVSLARKAAVGKKKKSEPDGAKAVNILAAIMALITAISMSSQWETVLKFNNFTPFGITDPVFGMDIGFFTFTLPFYSLVIGFLLSVFISTAVLSGISYIIYSSGLKVSGREENETVSGQWGSGGNPFSPQMGGGINLKWTGSWKRFMPQMSILLMLIFTVISANIYLSKYSLLLTQGDAVFGAGYTDIFVNIPLLTVLSGITFIIGLLFLANIRIKKPRFIVYGIAAFFAISFIGILISGAVQGLVVGPDEFNLEKTYLEKNIEWTLAAYGLDNAQEDIFPVTYKLTADDIADNSATVNNIRLWDWRPLTQTYDQLQLFRTYYEFNDVDVDRYQIDGTYKQVLVSAREMNTQDLPDQAKTWVNSHLVYTHGYGVVMNPVDKVTPGGLPEFYLKDIPPSSEYIPLDEMRIYYGEKTDDYVITGASTKEFDYPSGEENIYTVYSGSGGVPLTEFLTKLIYAFKFKAVELLVSGSLTAESKLLMNRNIGERASAIAPFFIYDYDPYVVISEGRLFWIMDAYTTTDMYPYSQPLRLGGDRMNYIRNSVKVVIDAYSGEVRYFIVDEEDPLIQTYRKMFPDVFLNFDEMPADLKSHLRYPEVMFSIQANIYSTYHMKDPMVFYNKEDVWVTPDEIYRGSRETMQPYYIIMKLPGEEKEEFILMIPFTPKGKENMIGWMAARSDVPNYGNVLVYKFSKQELTYGPMQIEARIDQDTDISQLITLWSQSGSSVVRGNTLVIPIEDSILYVEPLYLEATEKGTLPQLQRVIVSYGDKLTMQDTFSNALDVIFGSGTAPAGDSDEPPISQTDLQKLSRISDLYDLAQLALNDGDLGLYQDYVNQIGNLVSG